MKPSYILLLVLSAAVGATLGACSTFGGAATQSPAQVATAFCGPAQSIIAVLKADTAIAASGQAVITKAAPQVTALCAAASTANATNLQSLTTIVVNTVFPIAEATHPELVPDIIAAQAIIGIVEAAVPTPAVTK